MSFLFLSAILPASLSAQIVASNPLSDTTAVLRLATDNSVAVSPSATSDDPEQQAQPTTSGTKPTKPKPPGTDEPPIKGSMVGYIDDAIVGNEFRIRFDAAFDNNFPDRAEYFYAQCGCDGGTARGPAPGLATAVNFQQLYLRSEYAPIKRLSFLIDVPIRWLQPQSFAPQTAPGFTNQAGLSDVVAGFKFALLASERRYLTFQFLTSFPSGNSTQGLGTNHTSIAPELLYFQRVTGRFSFEGQVGDSHPIGNDTPGFPGDVFTYGIGPSYIIYSSEKVNIAPVIEFVGWRVLGGMENNAALIGVVTPLPVQSTNGINIFNIKGGFRTSVGKHDSFYVGFGQAVTHQVWYKHIIRLEYRRTF
jgi:hypothetical protein